MVIKNKILDELCKNQRKNIITSKRFQYTDLKRIAKYIDTSIFDENECCIWKGYITNLNKVSKGVYINFYFRGKKYVLHRLLYINYVGDLENNEYIKFTCKNKGKCCNINHIVKYSDDNNNKNIKPVNNIIKKNDDDEDSIGNKSEDFVINF